MLFITNTTMHKSREKPCWTTASEPPYPNGGPADKIYNFLRSSPRALSVYVQGIARVLEQVFVKTCSVGGLTRSGLGSGHITRAAVHAVLSSTTSNLRTRTVIQPHDTENATNIHSAGRPRVSPSNLRSWC